MIQSEAKEMSGVSSISLGNCNSVFSSVRLNHLPLEERWGGPYPGPKSNLNPQRLLKPLQVISIQTHGKSTNTHKNIYFVVLYLFPVPFFCPTEWLMETFTEKNLQVFRDRLPEQPEVKCHAQAQNKVW